MNSVMFLDTLFELGNSSPLFYRIYFSFFISGSITPQGLTKMETIQVKVRAVLKKRDYGSKYTQNNFITAVRAMNEFCLKPR